MENLAHGSSSAGWTLAVPEESAGWSHSRPFRYMHVCMQLHCGDCHPLRLRRDSFGEKGGVAGDLICFLCSLPAQTGQVALTPQGLKLPERKSMCR